MRLVRRKKSRPKDDPTQTQRLNDHSDGEIIEDVGRIDNDIDRLHNIQVKLSMNVSSHGTEDIERSLIAGNGRSKIKISFVRYRSNKLEWGC